MTPRALSLDGANGPLIGLAPAQAITRSAAQALLTLRLHRLSTTRERMDESLHELKRAFATSGSPIDERRRAVMAFCHDAADAVGMRAINRAERGHQLKNALEEVDKVARVYAQQVMQALEASPAIAGEVRRQMDWLTRELIESENAPRRVKLPGMTA